MSDFDKGPKRETEVRVVNKINLPNIGELSVKAQDGGDKLEILFGGSVISVVHTAEQAQYVLGYAAYVYERFDAEKVKNTLDDAIADGGTLQDSLTTTVTDDIQTPFDAKYETADEYEATTDRVEAAFYEELIALANKYA